MNELARGPPHACVGLVLSLRLLMLLSIIPAVGHVSVFPVANRQSQLASRAAATRADTDFGATSERGRSAVKLAHHGLQSVLTRSAARGTPGAFGQFSRAVTRRRSHPWRPSAESREIVGTSIRRRTTVPSMGSPSRMNIKGGSQPFSRTRPTFSSPQEQGQVSYTGLVFSPDGHRLFLSNVNAHHGLYRRG